VSDALAEVVLRCMARDPHDRPKDADEVAMLLARACTGDACAETGTPIAPTLTEMARSDFPKTAESVRRSPRNGSLARRAAITIAAIAALSVVAFVALRGDRRGAAASSPSSSASGARPVPTAITDVPLPKTTSPDASAAYLAGAQSLRDASMMTAISDFERAATLDPGSPPRTCALCFTAAASPR
jgi:hypothetical protein